MQRIEFEEAVENILEKDSRYPEEAYLFLRDALDFTIKETNDPGTKENRHVSGPELLEGFRKYALNEFGPMAPTVFEEWGIGACKDIGNMVFNLIDVGVFGKTENDRREDFEGVYDFNDAFRKPFLPAGGGLPMRRGPRGDGGRASSKRSEKSA